MANNEVVRFQEGYKGLDPNTIYEVGQDSLTPFSSADAYKGKGYQFGQERLADTAQYANFSIK